MNKIMTNDSFSQVLKKRLFAAVMISAENCPKLIAFSKKIKKTFGQHEIDVRWVSPQNWHITVWFFGDAVVDIKKIHQALKKVAEETSAFDLDIKGAGAFPDELAARIIWAGAATTKELRTLHNKVGAALNLTDDYEKFMAHITLGRLRNQHSVKKIISPFLRQKLDKIIVGELVLIESQMQNYGSAYNVLERYPLTSK
ncbi:MAG: 2'-5' RNA ligase [Bdellovibrionales bacterium RBG_16_40_8]|nr:MAG: 2'-5' RNA ligase [Bdellovibrionales bacterium RBG_16_40_8]